MRPQIGDTVIFHYMCSTSDGQFLESTAGGEPVQLTLGKKEILPGLEAAIIEMSIGEYKAFEYPASKAFGLYRKELVTVVNRNQLPDNVQPEIGMQLHFNIKGVKKTFKIIEISENSVILDANHPLAGKDITYHIQLLDIRSVDDQISSNSSKGLNEHIIRVNFLIIGTQKGGTSALARYLSLHPAICMPECKEVHFFTNEYYFSKPLVDYNIYYHSFFRPNQSTRLFGEATPEYMYRKNAIKRIWEYNPGMQLIMILRNPIDRAFSAWNMARNSGTETRSFYDAMKDARKKFNESLPLHQLINLCYVDRGLYSKQIKYIWQYFPKDQTLILKNEDLKNYPERTLNKVFKFLNIECLKDIKPEIFFSTPYITSLARDEKLFLLNIFKSEIGELERMLKWNCSDWLRI